MSPLKDLFTRLHAEANAIGEALRGQAAERLLQEDISRLEEEIGDWRAEIAATAARILLCEERKRELASAIRSLETDLLACLRSTRKKAQARALAEEIAEKTQLRETEKAELSRLGAHRQAMQQVLHQGEQTLRRLQQQLDTLRASETLQRAQAAVARRQSADAAPESALHPARRARAQKTGSASQTGQTPSLDAAAEAILARVAARAAKAPQDPPRKKPSRSKRP